MAMGLLTWKGSFFFSFLFLPSLCSDFSKEAFVLGDLSLFVTIVNGED